MTLNATSLPNTALQGMAGARPVISPALTAELALAVSTGLLRPLDSALVGFLVSYDDAGDELVYWLAALTSEQHGQGHLHLDIPLFLSTPERLGWSTSLAETLLAGWQALGWPLIRGRLLASCLIEEVTARASHDLAGTTPLVLDGDCLYLRRAWRDEVWVAEALRQRLRAATNWSAETDLRPVLDRLFPPHRETGSQPDWQKLACALAARQALTVITGGPGTGKTTTVVKLLGLLQSLALTGTGKALRIALAAPTGLAAARLNRAISGAVAALPLPAEVRAAVPAEVTTIHRLLGPLADSRRFRHQENNPLLLDVLVIDEASMLDLELMAAVLRALPATARLILLGDKDQLASVEAGAIMGDLCYQAESAAYAPALGHWLQQQSGEDVSSWVSGSTRVDPVAQHVIMLRHSYRFDAGRGIGRLAQSVRDGSALAVDDFSEFAPEVQVLPRDDLFDYYQAYWQCLHQPPVLVAGQDGESLAWQDWARRVMEAFGEFRILCAVRAGEHGVAGVNAACERYLGVRQGYQDSITWYVGRPVMVTRNDYALALVNGDVGITLWWPDAEAADGRRLRVVFPASDSGDAALRWFLPSRLPAVETVFAMTVHKAQGSEFGCAALVLPTQMASVLTRELVYTALTRARHKFLLCQYESPVWRQSIGRQALRSSGLRARLAQ